MMKRINSVETKSFEVISATIEVIDDQTGSKSIFSKYYSIGYKKNGDKYFKITGIPEFYKTHAKSLTKDAIAISFIPPKDLHSDDAIFVRGGEHEDGRHYFRMNIGKLDNTSWIFWQDTNESNHSSIDWINVMNNLEIIIHHPKLIELKILPKYFTDQKNGMKNFEIRKNDRGYQVDDLLLLKEYDPENEQYTGRFLKRKITYITSYKQQEGYVVLGTTPVLEKE